MYVGNVFISTSQWNLLNSIKDPTAFLNDLVIVIFGKEVLKTSRVTGNISNRNKGEAKKPLDKTKLSLVYDLMAEKTNSSTDFSPKNINKKIAKKINNLNAVKKNANK